MASHRIPHQPTNRSGFEIALICALPLESNALEALFDKFWEDEGVRYGKTTRDENAYLCGVMSGCNVVLAHMPNMGKVAAASVASSLGLSFPKIKLALVVGICGGVPSSPGVKENIFLGDVVISDALIQYDLGQQYPHEFEKKETLEDSLGRASRGLRALLRKLQSGRGRERLQIETTKNLNNLLERGRVAPYPGMDLDVLFDSSYRHKHPTGADCRDCSVSGSDPDRRCESALRMTCNDIGCDTTKSVSRRHRTGWQETLNSNGTPHAALPNTIESHGPQPRVHIGRMASGDTVMKSGLHRDRIAYRENVVAFEMEGAGVWDHFPSLVIKGVCDYADSHKNKLWQPYAAATAAACVKAFLHAWVSENGILDGEDEPSLSFQHSAEVAAAARLEPFDDIIDNRIPLENTVTLPLIDALNVTAPGRRRNVAIVVIVFGIATTVLFIMITMSGQEGLLSPISPSNSREPSPKPPTPIPSKPWIWDPSRPLKIEPLIVAAPQHLTGRQFIPETSPSVYRFLMSSKIASRLNRSSYGINYVFTNITISKRPLPLDLKFTSESLQEYWKPYPPFLFDAYNDDKWPFLAPYLVSNNDLVPTPQQSATYHNISLTLWNYHNSEGESSHYSMESFMTPPPFPFEGSPDSVAKCSTYMCQLPEMSLRCTFFLSKTKIRPNGCDLGMNFWRKPVTVVVETQRHDGFRSYQNLFGTYGPFVRCSEVEQHHENGNLDKGDQLKFDLDKTYFLKKDGVNVTVKLPLVGQSCSCSWSSYYS